MKVEDMVKGMTVTVRPAVRGVARFDGVVLGTAGNFVMLKRGEQGERWVVGAHECQPYDGLTDFQREILRVVTALKNVSVSDMPDMLDTFKFARTLKERGAQEASVTRAVKLHPLSNFVEVRRLEGKNKKERTAMLYLKESQ